MASLNSSNLTGRIVKDPELRNTTTGKQVTTITLAIDGWNDTTSFIDCVCWGKTAEIASQYATKGKMVGVSGRLEQRSWEKDGNKRSTIEVVVNDLVLLSPKQESEARQDVVPTDIDDEAVDLSEIPF